MSSWLEMALESVGGSAGSGEPGSSEKSCPLKQGTLLVTVQRSDTQEAIQNASVTVTGPTPGSGQSQGDYGAALFDPIDAGAYEVEIALGGEDAKNFEAPEKQSTSVAGGSTEVLLFWVGAPANLEVEVLSESDGKPIADATVKVSGPDSSESSTDTSGKALFEAIHSGKYTVSIGFSSSKQSKYQNPSDQSIELTGNETGTLVFKVRPPDHYLEIELVDEDGNTFPGEKYEVELPDGRKISGKLDDKGRARVEDIPQAGTCKVSFPDLGHEMEMQTQGS